jgi:cation:H+ antiporter
MLTDILILAAGFLLLLRGAHYLVAGASSLAKRLGVRSLVIGLTVVAFGTSAPEFVVNTVAAWRGTTDIAIGNVIGSNLANILLILGAAAAITPLKVQRNTVWKEIPFSLLAALLVLVMGSDVILDQASANVISRVEGFVLIAFFVIFLYYTVGIAKATGEAGEPISDMPVPRTALYILAGLAALVIGGSLIVDSAVSLARTAGISEHLIALTIVAVGTSLPELATSVVAAMKRHADIAIGNAIGSNIFNVFWILGASSTIRQLPFGNLAQRDALMLIIVSVVLFASLFVGSKHRLDRWQGWTFIGLYAGYIAFAVLV